MVLIKSSFSFASMEIATIQSSLDQQTLNTTFPQEFSALNRSTDAMAEQFLLRTHQNHHPMALLNAKVNILFPWMKLR